MPSVDDAFPSEWLKPADLQGRAHTVTIKAYEQGEYMGKVQHILHFYETKKKLGLNKGTAQQIGEYLGIREMTQWPDHKITIFANRENQKGEWRDVIRCQMSSAINEQQHVPQQPAPQQAFGVPAGQQQMPPGFQAPQQPPQAGRPAISDDDIPF